jgi:hypothetical protein
LRDETTMDGIAGSSNRSWQDAGKASDGKTRRVEIRQEVDTAAVIRLIDLAANVKGRILDVSMGGCRIRTDRRFPVGIFRRVETEFRIDGLPFRVAGVTQNIYDGFNVGIRFLDMSDRRREMLAQLIEEIKELRERERAATTEETAGSSAEVPESPC